MAERLKAIRGFSYPDPSSIAAVRDAGGLSKMSPEEGSKVKMKYVAPGDYCDDMPKESQGHYIATGGIVVEEVAKFKSDIEGPSVFKKIRRKGGA